MRSPRPRSSSSNGASDVEARERARLRWRCRRGLRELDVLLARYMDGRFTQAPSSERAAFAALLELPDPELMDLLMGRLTAPGPEIAIVVARILKTDPHR